MDPMGVEEKQKHVFGNAFVGFRTYLYIFLIERKFFAQAAPSSWKSKGIQPHPECQISGIT